MQISEGGIMFRYWFDPRVSAVNPALVIFFWMAEMAKAVEKGAHPVPRPSPFRKRKSDRRPKPARLRK